MFGVGEGAVVLDQGGELGGDVGRGDEFGAALSGGGVEEAAELFGQDGVAVRVLALGRDGAGPQVTAGLGR